jgi:hypothetical protein
MRSAEIEPDIRLSRERAGRVTKLARWRKIALEPFFRAFLRAFFGIGGILLQRSKSLAYRR